MLVENIYGLLPAFVVTSFLGILLWPENIAFKNRLRLFMAVLIIWMAASGAGMAGYGTSENRLICFINLVVGCLGLIAVFLTYHTKPTRN